MKRRPPKFPQGEAGDAARDASAEKMEKQMIHAIDKALNDAAFDPRHAALRRAQASDEGVAVLAGEGRDSILAVMQMQSAERTNAALTRATWGLVAATVALVVATIVLVVVTILNR